MGVSSNDDILQLNVKTQKLALLFIHTTRNLLYNEKRNIINIKEIIV